MRFVADIVRGGRIGAWHLATGAGTEATRVWAQRNSVGDLGHRLRHAGPEAWPCDLVEASVDVSRSSPFTVGDQRAVTGDAEFRGAKRAEIDALLADVVKLDNDELAAAVAAVCR